MVNLRLNARWVVAGPLLIVGGLFFASYSSAVLVNNPRSLKGTYPDFNSQYTEARTLGVHADTADPGAAAAAARPPQADSGSSALSPGSDPGSELGEPSATTSPAPLEPVQPAEPPVLTEPPKPIPVDPPICEPSIDSSSLCYWPPCNPCAAGRYCPRTVNSRVSYPCVQPTDPFQPGLF